MKIALYCRVSTEKQEREETIQSQLGALRSHAAKEKHEITGEYLDEGYSGELLARPALDRLRDDAKKKLFDAILVHSPDRLSRKYIYLGIVQEEFKKYSISVVFLNRPDAKDTPEENLLSGVQGLIAEYEKAKILERTRRGKIHKVQSGVLVSSIAPFGYRYVPRDKASHTVGRYELVEPEAKIVRLIFDLFVRQSMSIRKIARELTRLNIPPRRGRQWRTSSLHRIIRNTTYFGLTYFNKNMSCEARKSRSGVAYKRAKNTSMKLRPQIEWIPIKLPDNLKIIDKKTFDVAQALLKRNAELSPRNVKHEYLLRGLVQCAKCGSPYGGTPCHGKLFYRCANRNRTFPLPRTCKAPTIPTARLEAVVWSKFCQVIQKPDLIARQITKLKEGEARRMAGATKDGTVIERELQGLETEENRLLDAYRAEALTVDQLKAQMGKIQEKRKRLAEEMATSIRSRELGENRGKFQKSITDYCRQVAKRLRAAENDFQSKRYLLERAIVAVVVDGPKVKIRGIIPTNSDETRSEGAIRFPLCS